MKTKNLHSEANRQILEEASEWFVDFRVGDVDAEARGRFDEWLRRSPEHIRAYWEIAKTYVDLPSASDLANLDVNALIAYAHSEGNVVPMTAGRPTAPHGLSDLGPQNATVRRRFGRRERIAAAACAVLAVLGGVLWWNAERYPLYATDTGERRSLTLSDGTAVELNARSSIRIQFSRAERRVELLDGQVLFQVSKDKQRPFIVRSGDATVRAVGTQFDVNRTSAGTTVTVLEGQVAVYSTRREAQEPIVSGPAAPLSTGASGKTAAAPANASRPEMQSHAGERGLPSLRTDPSEGQAVYLSAGEQVIVTPKVIAEPQRADVTAATAWTQPRLTFDGSKLADVVAEFNRYNRRQLLIEGKDLADFRVSGIYSSTDPTSLLRFLREQPGIRVSETDTEVRIERR